MRTAPVSRTDEKFWGVAVHLGVPLLGVVVPLVVYLTYRDRSPWLRESAAEALDFAVVYTAVGLVSVALVPLVVGYVLLPLVLVAGLAVAGLAAGAASRREPYRYPVSWRVVS